MFIEMGNNVNESNFHPAEEGKKTVFSKVIAITLTIK